MVLEPDTGRCANEEAKLQRGVDTGASEEAKPRRGVDTRRCASKDAGPRREWLVRSHIGWGGERNILYKSVETFPYQTHFKALRESPDSGGLEPLLCD